MFVDADTQSLVFKAQDPFMIRDLLSKSRIIDHPDYNIQVKHTLEAAKVLRNIGIEAPGPIMREYSWPGKFTPFDHQYKMADFYTMHRRCFNLSEMGTGKTAPTLWAADYLMNTRRVRKVLILSPISTMDRVWKKNIFEILMHRSCVILHGSRERRLEMLQFDVDFYILNHDGVSIKDVNREINHRPDIDLVIVDEGSMFRNGSTHKYKMLRKMLRDDQRLWWLTGTPCPTEPTDAWAQAQLVSPRLVPKFFGQFRRMTMYNVSTFKWVARTDGFEHAYNALQPAIRFLKKDCLDLPEVTETERQAKLTDAQRKAFKEMKEVMQAEAKTTMITAVNAADKINKLRQILCGVIKDPITGEYIVIDHQPRAEALAEIIEQASAKVYVMVPFKGIVYALKKYLSKRWSVEIVNGDVPRKKRDDIFTRFSEEKDPKVLLCHPKVMAHGLDFTVADVCVLYAPIYSNDEFEQGIERMNRAGQKLPMTIAKIGAHPLDWQIYNMLNARRTTQENILKLFNEVIQ